MDKETVEEIEPFVANVKKKFAPNQISLFGSRASNKAWKRSDYDFIIVSDKFKDIHWLDRISKTVRLWDRLEDVDILPYTPQEFNHKKVNSSMVRRAVKEGIVL